MARVKRQINKNVRFGRSHILGTNDNFGFTAGYQHELEKVVRVWFATAVGFVLSDEIFVA